MICIAPQVMLMEEYGRLRCSLTGGSNAQGQKNVPPSEGVGMGVLSIGHAAPYLAPQKMRSRDGGSRFRASVSGS